MGHQHILELVGIHVKARHHDHVLLAIDNAHITIGLHQRDVSGGEPAVAVNHLGRGLGALPVAGHNLRAAHTELPRLVEPECIARIIANLDLRAGYRHADGAYLYAIAGIR